MKELHTMKCHLYNESQFSLMQPKCPFCFWYNSSLVKWFTSFGVQIWTKVFIKKCLYAKILKTGIFMFEYRFFYIAWRIFGNKRLIWVIQQNFIKVKCFAKLENWHVTEETLCRFHTVHMTVLLDLSSVLITFVFGNSLIKTSFEAKVIRSLEN